MLLGFKGPSKLDHSFVEDLFALGFDNGLERQGWV